MKTAALIIRHAAFWIIAAALAVVAGWGKGPILQLLTEGHSVTGMNDTVPWGVFIPAYAALLGLAAGSLMVAGIAYTVAKKLWPLARLATVTSLASFAAAGGLITLDLGKPERMLNLLLHPNWSSTLVWEVAAISAAAGVALLMLLVSLISSKTRILSGFGVLAVLLGISVNMLSCLLFGLTKGMPGWNSPLLAPVFLASSLVSGAGLVAVILMAVTLLIGYSAKEEVWLRLGAVLRYAMILLVLLIVSELVWDREHLRNLIESSFGEHVRRTGVLLGMALILSFIPHRLAVFFSGIAAVAGVYLERLIIIMPPQLHRQFIQYPGATYTATALENIIVMAIIAGGLLLVLLTGKVVATVEKE